MFSFDPTLAIELIGSPRDRPGTTLVDDTGDPLPVDVLERMPYPAFVIMTNLPLEVRSVMVYQLNGDTPEFSKEGMDLSLLAHVTKPDGDWGLISAGLNILPGMSIRQAIEHSLALREKNLGIVATKEDQQQFQGLFSFAIPLITYLCAQNRDIDGELAVEPMPSKTKRGPRLFPPQRTSIAEVGTRIGSALRMHRQAPPSNGAGTGTGAAMPPHVRRFHWHAFWTGPRDKPELRKRVLHFLPPIPVNLPGLTEPPAVVRPVQG
jgi:hypothetical protein